MEDTRTAGVGVGRRDGCLRPTLLILGLGLVTVCCILGGLAAAATRPGGIALGLGTFVLSVETRLDTFQIGYAYQFAAQEGSCLREDSLVVVYDPLEVRRIPGCHCTLPDPNFAPVVVQCEEAGVR